MLLAATTKFRFQANQGKGKQCTIMTASSIPYTLALFSIYSAVYRDNTLHLPTTLLY